MLGLITDIH